MVPHTDSNRGPTDYKTVIIHFNPFNYLDKIYPYTPKNRSLFAIDIV